MTDYQYKTVLASIMMITDGCKDVAEVKEKIRQLIEGYKKQQG